MNDTKVIQIAGFLFGLILMFAIFDQEIDIAKDWWASIPVLLVGILIGLVAYGIDKKLHNSGKWGFGVPTIVFILLVAAGTLFCLYFFVNTSTIAFFIGVLAVKVVLPAIDHFKDDRDD